jgi:hypothetical protein
VAQRGDHRPRRRLHFYSDFAPMTASEAWTLFGEGNGAASLVLQLLFSGL